MNEIDARSKLFFGKNERFADLINGSLYQGKQKLSAQELEEMDTEANQIVYGKRVMRRRDLLKRSQKDGTGYAMYGLELQSTQDREMPVRMMMYDAMMYQKMLETERKISPMKTLCMYSGEKPWNAPTRLHEMMELPEEMKGIIEDYGMTVVEVLSADIRNYHHPEVRGFFELFQDIHQMSASELTEKYESRALSAEVVETVAVLGKCDELRKWIKKDQEGRKVCTNFKRIVQEWKKEGIEQGIEIGEQKAQKETIRRLCNVNASLDIMAAATGLSESEVRRFIVQQGLRTSF